MENEIDMAYTHLLSPEERERRNNEIALKFKKQYHPGVKKYYLYELLAKEYNLKTETIATIVHPRQWGINGGKFKSKKQELEYFREYHAKKRKSK
jgi:hypothetical protein